MIEDNVAHIYNIGDVFISRDNNDRIQITKKTLGKHGGINYRVLVNDSIIMSYPQSFLNRCTKLY